MLYASLYNRDIATDKQMQYASFGTPTVSDEFLVTESYMAELGKRYALECKPLPVKVELPGRPFPFHIKRSSHPWANAFTDSYFANKSKD